MGFEKQLVGRSIKEVRPMTEAERKSYAWYERGVVIVLDDNTQLIPSQDPEGNGAGVLFAESPRGGTFVIG